jgi:hypothetical protein
MRRVGIGRLWRQGINNWERRGRKGEVEVSEGKRRDRLEYGILTPHPGHAVDSPNRRICKNVECSRGEIKTGLGATRAAVSHSYSDGLFPIGSSDLAIADRVIVGIYAVVTRVYVE